MTLLNMTKNFDFPHNSAISWPSWFHGYTTMFSFGIEERAFLVYKSFPMGEIDPTSLFAIHQMIDMSINLSLNGVVWGMDFAPV